MNIAIPKTRLEPGERRVITVSASFVRPTKLVLPDEVALAVLVHDVAGDGKSIFNALTRGPLPGLVFRSAAIGADPFDSRLVRQFIQLDVSVMPPFDGLRGPSKKAALRIADEGLIFEGMIEAVSAPSPAS